MNLVSPLFGGIPMCYGAGGVGGHVRFGAKTAGALVIPGSLRFLIDKSIKVNQKKRRSICVKIAADSPTNLLTTPKAAPRNKSGNATAIPKSIRAQKRIALRNASNQHQDILNLCFSAALYGLGKAERQGRARKLLHDFDLTKAADRRFGGYSKGMKRKLTIAAGFIHMPEILFLDEPTTGIDVASARQIRQLITDLHRAGTTTFLTTHYIEEAERLCDRIAFMVDGCIKRRWIL